MDAAEYKHVVLGLIFLKYLSEALDEYRKYLEAQISNHENELYINKPSDSHATLEDRRPATGENLLESHKKRVGPCPG